MTDIRGELIANPKWRHIWFPDTLWIHPDLVAAGLTEDDLPITDLRVSTLRMELEKIDFPPAFRNAETGELQIVTGGEIPAMPVDHHKGFDCVKLKLTDDASGESVTKRYLLFCPQGTNGAGTDYGDDGTWHGEPTREDEARNKANEEWLEWIENPSG